MSNGFEIIKDDDATIPSDRVPHLLKSLNEAKRHVAGEKVKGMRTSQIEVPEPDVSSIRKTSGLSQVEFSKWIGVSVGTLRGWEQRRRTPRGPAKVLLALIAKRPDIVQEELQKIAS